MDQSSNEIPEDITAEIPAMPEFVNINDAPMGGCFATYNNVQAAIGNNDPHAITLLHAEIEGWKSSTDEWLAEARAKFAEGIH